MDWERNEHMPPTRAKTNGPSMWPTTSRHGNCRLTTQKLVCRVQILIMITAEDRHAPGTHQER